VEGPRSPDENSWIPINPFDWGSIRGCNNVLSMPQPGFLSGAIQAWQTDGLEGGIREKKVVGRKCREMSIQQDERKPWGRKGN